MNPSTLSDISSTPSTRILKTTTGTHRFTTKFRLNHTVCIETCFFGRKDPDKRRDVDEWLEWAGSGKGNWKTAIHLTIR